MIESIKNPIGVVFPSIFHSFDAFLLFCIISILIGLYNVILNIEIHHVVTEIHRVIIKYSQ